SSTTQHCQVLLFFFSMSRPPPRFTLFPYTTLFRSSEESCQNKSSTCDIMNHSHSRLHICTCALGHRHRRHTAASLSFYFCTSNRSEEHTSELQSRFDLVCRLLLEKKNKAKCCLQLF